MKFPLATAGVPCLVLTAPLSAQELDPRAYANIPVNTMFLVASFSVSHGGVVSDPTLPDLDIHATVENTIARRRALVQPVRPNGAGVQRTPTPLCGGAIRR